MIRRWTSEGCRPPSMNLCQSRPRNFFTVHTSSSRAGSNEITRSWASLDTQVFGHCAQSFPRSAPRDFCYRVSSAESLSWTATDTSACAQDFTLWRKGTQAAASETDCASSKLRRSSNSQGRPSDLFCGTRADWHWRICCLRWGSCPLWLAWGACRWTSLWTAWHVWSQTYETTARQSCFLLPRSLILGCTRDIFYRGRCRCKRNLPRGLFLEYLLFVSLKSKRSLISVHCWPSPLHILRVGFRFWVLSRSLRSDFVLIVCPNLRRWICDISQSRDRIVRMTGLLETCFLGSLSCVFASSIESLIEFFALPGLLIWDDWHL